MIDLPPLDTVVWPFVACLLLVGILGYLGIHVLARKVIFVDLAMAQIAALGATYAFLLGNDIKSNTAYFLSLGFTLAGAAVFAATRTRHEKIPHEATIGLVYAMASAGGILLADRSPHGAEHIKGLLQGSIVWVTRGQVLRFAGIVAVVGAFQFVFRHKFLAISSDPDAARASGLNVRFWDFLFYLSFGFVITSSVPIAGVLLVFCFLIAPGVAASLFADSVRARVLIGWGAGILVSALGIVFSYNHPTGPTIMCVFAGLLAAAAVVKAVLASEHRLRAAGLAAAGGLALAGLASAGNHLLASDEEDHEHEVVAHPTGNTPADLIRSLSDEHATVRRESAKALGEQGRREAVPELIKLLSDKDAGVQEEVAKALDALRATEAIPALKDLAGRRADDEWVPLEAARALAGLGSRDGIDRLLDIAGGDGPGQVRREALKHLKQVLPEAKAPADPKRGLDELASWWKAHAPAAVFDPNSRLWNGGK